MKPHKKNRRASWCARELAFITKYVRQRKAARPTVSTIAQALQRPVSTVSKMLRERRVAKCRSKLKEGQKVAEIVSRVRFATQAKRLLFAKKANPKAYPSLRSVQRERQPLRQSEREKRREVKKLRQQEAREMTQQGFQRYAASQRFWQ